MDAWTWLVFFLVAGFAGMTLYTFFGHPVFLHIEKEADGGAPAFLCRICGKACRM